MSLRRILSEVLAAFILASGAVMTPDTVWCLGPGNHCHFETVVGGSCDERLAPSEHSTPQPSDGCPKGSKDFRASVDTHRGGNRPLVGAPCATSAWLPVLIPGSISSRSGPRLFASQRQSKSLLSTIVLRN